ncbi:IS110 family transposase [Bacteroides sp.]|uniref:IS110 family transposase n=1 Tax=Bacteroides sp. TaxID=29523 RepID=UPI00345CC708
MVMEMPGVGDILGPRIIAEIGDIRRFHSASALIAYAGLDAPPYQSGDFTATNRSISNGDQLRCVRLNMKSCDI